MDTVLVSRQPIYGPKMDVFGYELLFRDDEEDRAKFVNPERATAEVIVNTFMEIGLSEMVGPHLAFINFDRNLILRNLCESLPPKRVILEILENVDPDDEQVLRRLQELSAKGYRIALDDFVCSERYYPLIAAAHFVKLDLLQYDNAGIERTIKALERFPVKIIAEKVETHEQFEFSKEVGFDYFQGYFFCRPQLVRSTKVPVGRMATLMLISKLNEPNVTLNDLQDAIGRDVSLSYKLLRYVNSALCGLRRHVDSIGHAAALVGSEKLRIWASLILFAGLGEKPRDLILTGVVRARMCEELADMLALPDKDRFFLAGLFSVLDAILDRPLEDILVSLPLSPELTAALLRFEGPHGGVLQCVMAYERQDWRNVKYGNLDIATVRLAYGKALSWSLPSLSGAAG